MKYLPIVSQATWKFKQSTREFRLVGEARGIGPADHAVSTSKLSGIESRVCYLD